MRRSRRAVALTTALILLAGIVCGVAALAYALAAPVWTPVAVAAVTLVEVVDQTTASDRLDATTPPGLRAPPAPLA